MGKIICIMPWAHLIIIANSSPSCRHVAVYWFIWRILPEINIVMEAMGSIFSYNILRNNIFVNYKVYFLWLRKKIFFPKKVSIKKSKLNNIAVIYDNVLKVAFSITLQFKFKCRLINLLVWVEIINVLLKCKFKRK